MATSKAWATTLNLGPVTNGSIGLYDIDGDGKDEIFVGTSKNYNGSVETKPAGFACLEDDGTVKWTVTFPSIGTSPNDKTTAVTGAPLFTDVDGNGKIDIVVSVGGNGQPGNNGGVYALNADGTIKWFHQSQDINGTLGGGVFGSAAAFDIDGDGVREIIYGSWDRNLWVLDGRTGVAEQKITLYDSIASTPRIADLNGDGVFEIVIGSDITANPAAGTQTGGILHVVSAYGNQDISGWNGQIGTTTNPSFRGKYDPQVLWSSPITADLDNDGHLEIIEGTGNFFQDTRGSYIKVWNADGSLRFTLATNGRTEATPLVADINGDGVPEIIAVTLDGYVHCWTTTGRQLFATQVKVASAPAGTKIALASAPLAVDMNADGKMEIILTAEYEVVVLNSDGVQINRPSEFVINSGQGAPAVRDIDHDGKLDVIGAGTNGFGQAVVYRWDNIYDTTATTYQDGRYQFNQSLTPIERFVERFYVQILGRASDPNGGNGWTDALYTGVRAGADVARGFIFSNEFQKRNLSNTDYISTLYQAFFNRVPDGAGAAGWLKVLDAGSSRSNVLDGFIFSQEFRNLCSVYGIKPAATETPNSGPGNDHLQGTEDADVLSGGSGNDWILGDGTVMPDAAYVANEVHNGQIFRLYGATLGRVPDGSGFYGWVNALDNKAITFTAAAGGFVASPEFQTAYGPLDNTGFVTLLYRNVLGRAPDSGGLAGWVNALKGGTSRESVVIGFSESAEYQTRTDPAFLDFMRTSSPALNDVIEGGAGNDTLSGARGSDLYIFRADAGGVDDVYGFEAWDRLQLSGFGYANSAAAMAHMTQTVDSVIFQDLNQTITFHGATLADMHRVSYNVS